MKILILGGYGTFGGRLAHLLADEESLTLVISGRSKQKAIAFCERLPDGAKKTALCFDRDGDVESQLRVVLPEVVVDATGPFQSYGDDPYRVVRACIAIGINYMDLADGSDFVKGIRQFDESAKTKNLFILSGVSSFPVLTAAVVRSLSYGLARIISITGGIAPSPYAGVGLNVIRAIASYSGKRVVLIRHGRQEYGHALTETMRFTIAPPGCLPLKNILFSLVDVPDLKVLPEIWPNLDSMWMGAGPVPEILHRMLIGLAWLVRSRFLPSLLPFASVFHLVTNVLRWGEHRGGMFILVKGSDANGKIVERSWHLLAEGNDGPFIPSMAIEAIIRRTLMGNLPVSGARPATNDLELEDYQQVFQSRDIYMGRREILPGSCQQPLFQRLLGDTWASLPELLRAFHCCNKEVTAKGFAEVERGSGFLSRVIGGLFRFPVAEKGIPVQVSMNAKDGSEVWCRIFGNKSFSSNLTEGKGRSDKLLLERFGPFTFGLALVFIDDRLYFVVRRWSFLGLPLPLVLAPTGNSYEFEAANHFCFNIEIRHTLIGLIVKYQGWLNLQ